jgi:hypothetical protein
MVMRILLVGYQAIDTASSESGGENTFAFLTSPATFGFASAKCLTSTSQDSRFYGLGDLFASNFAAALASVSRPVGR